MSFKEFSSRQVAPTIKPAKTSDAAPVADQPAKQPENNKPAKVAPARKA
jgi:hypothetical protein